MAQWPPLFGDIDVGTCLLAWCCPCIVAGNNAERAGTFPKVQITVPLFVLHAIVTGIGVYVVQWDAEEIAGRCVEDACGSDHVCSFQQYDQAIQCAEEADAARPYPFYASFLINLILLVIYTFLHIQIGNKFSLTDNGPCPAALCFYCGCPCFPLMQEDKVVKAARDMVGAPVGLELRGLDS